MQAIMVLARALAREDQSNSSFMVDLRVCSKDERAKRENKGQAGGEDERTEIW